MWTVWEVLWCISLWREFIFLFLCCKDLEFPWIPLAMALFQAALLFCLLLLPAGLTFCQVGRRERSTSPAMAVPIWSWALSRKPFPSLPEVQLSSLPCLLHMFQLSLLLLQFTHSYNPRLLSLQEIQGGKI